MNTKDAAIFPYLERTQQKMNTRNEAEIRASVQVVWGTLPDIMITRACNWVRANFKKSLRRRAVTSTGSMRAQTPTKSIWRSGGYW